RARTLVRTVKALRALLARHPSRSIGFVPTLGDLHEGHLSLIRRSKKENRDTVVSVFVNPTQFDRKEDFKRYHRDLRRDLALARRAKADYVFAPSPAELYPEGFETWVEGGGLARPLCVAVRPGHVP